MEVRNAALFAHELNRTLLLPPVVQGKTGYVLGPDEEAVWEEVSAAEVYDLDLLSRFVLTATSESEEARSYLDGADGANRTIDYRGDADPGAASQECTITAAVAVGEDT